MKVVRAPVFNAGEDLATQVAVGENEGLRHPGWIMTDNLISLRKSNLTYYVGSLSPAKTVELNRTLKMAFDWI